MTHAVYAAFMGADEYALSAANVSQPCRTRDGHVVIPHLAIAKLVEIGFRRCRI